MHAVLRLVEDNGVGGFHNLVGDFHAALGRQAVHEPGLLPGGGHELGSDLEPLEPGAPLFQREGIEG